MHCVALLSLAVGKGQLGVASLKRFDIIIYKKGYFENEKHVLCFEYMFVYPLVVLLAVIFFFFLQVF